MYQSDGPQWNHVAMVISVAHGHNRAAAVSFFARAFPPSHALRRRNRFKLRQEIRVIPVQESHHLPVLQQFLKISPRQRQVQVVLGVRSLDGFLSVSQLARRMWG